MKNWINITLIASLAVSAGCAKVDVVEAPGKSISFTVGTYAPQTRADGETVALNTLGITSFSSTAYMHGEGFEGADQKFFGADNVETISYTEVDATTASWLPSHEYFWPKNPSSFVNFFSWYGGSPDLDYAKGTSDKYEATMTWSNVSTSSLAGLMFADVAWHFNSNATVYRKEFENHKVDGGVPTLFHHALAQVKFVAKQKVVENPGRVTSFAVKVDEIKLTAVKNSATSFSLTTAEPDGTSPATTPWTVSGWDGLGGSSTIQSPAAVQLTTPGESYTVIPASTANPETEWVSVLPQPVADLKVNVTFTVTTTYGEKVVVEQVVVPEFPLSDFEGGITSWQFGKRYTYTIIIDPDAKKIKLIPEETDWIDAGSFDLTV